MESIHIGALMLLLVSPTHALAAKRATVPKIVGMTYADARLWLISKGWRPHPVCDAKIEDCAHQGATVAVLRQRGYDEVDACAVDGPWCVFNFIDKRGRCLSVSVEGEVDSSKKTELKVMGLVFECPDQP